MKFLLAAVAAAAVVAAFDGQAFNDGPGEALANDHHQVKEKSVNGTAELQVPEFTDGDYNDDDMEMLLGRSRWCRRRHNGRCLNPRKHSCGSGYQWSPMGKPYCIGKWRRCCYPVETTLTSTTTPATTTTTPTTPGNCSSSEGFFMVNGSNNQCYKFFTESGYTWEASRALCHDQGLRLAEPMDPVGLRKYMVETFGDEYAWIGALGTGSSVNWISDGTMIANSSTLWYNGSPRYTSTSYCLMLLSHSYEINSKPNSPFYMYDCTYSGWHPLCELVM